MSAGGPLNGPNKHRGMKPPLIVIAGPTGVGKSEVALEVASYIGGEILSSDSQQVYRGMDIGTGKPGIEQRGKVRHHLIDLVNPDEEYNAAMFRESALRVDGEIRTRGKQVVVCGGTGLYIKALLYGLFNGPARVSALRKEFEGEIKEKGIGYLYERLKQADPEGASSIHPNDRQRIIRALEVLSQTGKSISRWQEEHGFKESPFKSLIIGLNRDREELYALIDQRCDAMMAMGFVAEVEGLIAQGYGPDLKPMQSLGYRHIGLYLRGEKSLEEALFLMKRDTRKLAKRQLTWFRAEPGIQWFHPELDKEVILQSSQVFLSNASSH